MREEASDPFFAERGLSLASRSLSNAKTTTSTTSLARVLSPSLRIGNDGRTTFGRRTVSGAAGKHVNQPSNPADGRSARDGRTRTDSHIKCELESVDTFIALGGGRAGDRVFQVGRRGLGRQALPGREPDSEDPQSSSLSSRQTGQDIFFYNPCLARSAARVTDPPISRYPPSTSLSNYRYASLSCARHMPFIPPLKRWNA